MKPYCIWTVPYYRNSGGVRALYKLIDLLRQKGMTVAKNTPLSDAIAIYPEIVHGNPFHSKQVVRWVLQVPGMIGGPTSYAPSDFVFAYFKAFIPDNMHCDGDLYVSSTEPELFNTEGVGERKGGVCFVSKGRRTPRIAETLLLPEIKGDFPPNRAELANLLKRSEYLYTYDNSTALADEARLCGCPVIRIPDPFNNYHLEQWGNFATLGIVEDIKDIDKARSELPAFQEFYWEQVKQTDKQLDEFIRITQSLTERPPDMNAKDSCMQGIFFNPPIEDNYIGHIVAEIYKDRVYDPYLRGRKDLVILDIGANVGIFSYYASQFAKQVYAVEPSKDHFATLHRQLAFNHIENVSPFNLALANFNGKAEFYHNQNRTMYSLYSAIHDPKLGQEQVNCISIEDFFKQNNIEHVDFMKLDVEGAEFEILGGEAFGKVAEKIDMILFETHPWSNGDIDHLMASLKSDGFQVEPISNDAVLWIAKREKIPVQIPVKTPGTLLSKLSKRLRSSIIRRVKSALLHH